MGDVRWWLFKLSIRLAVKLAPPYKEGRQFVESIFNASFINVMDYINACADKDYYPIGGTEWIEVVEKYDKATDRDLQSCIKLRAMIEGD